MAHINRKYIDKQDGHSEAVYTGQKGKGVLTPHPEDMGTYNFFDYRRHPVLHFRFDVIPYMIYGNSPNDNSTFIGRIYYSVQ